MSRARSALVAAATAVTALVIGSVPAAAGGPTSVLVANPASGTTGALYMSDADYVALQRALEPADTAVDEPPTLASGPGTSAINATWLVHDVTVWRVDRISLDAGPQVWVQTTLAGDEGIDWTSNAEWHVASDAETVHEILGRLGVIPGEAASMDTAAAGADTAAAGAAEEPPAGTDDGTSPLWWLLPGIAAGAVLGALGRPLAAGVFARRRIVGPRHQLIDV